MALPGTAWGGLDSSPPVMFPGPHFRGFAELSPRRSNVILDQEDSGSWAEGAGAVMRRAAGAGWLVWGSGGVVRGGGGGAAASMRRQRYGREWPGHRTHACCCPPAPQPTPTSSSDARGAAGQGSLQPPVPFPPTTPLLTTPSAHSLQRTMLGSIKNHSNFFHPMLLCLPKGFPPTPPCLSVTPSCHSLPVSSLLSLQFSKAAKSSAQQHEPPFLLFTPCLGSARNFRTFHQPFILQ